MIRPPPRSPLFPYTPLSRSGPPLFRARAAAAAGSGAEHRLRLRQEHARLHRAQPRQLAEGARPAAEVELDRSEEHTSELQSQSNLVCRLLLEKKKTQNTQHPDLSYIITSMLSERPNLTHHTCRCSVAHAHYVHTPASVRLRCTAEHCSASHCH